MASLRIKYVKTKTYKFKQKVYMLYYLVMPIKIESAGHQLVRYQMTVAQVNHP